LTINIFTKLGIDIYIVSLQLWIKFIKNDFLTYYFINYFLLSIHVLLIITFFLK